MSLVASSSSAQVPCLHLQPLGARLLNALQYGSAVCHRKGPKKGWPEKVLRVLTVSTSLAANTIIVPLTLIEFVASATLSLMGMLIHQVSDRKSALVERWTVKALSYSFNTIPVLVVAMASFFLRLAPFTIPRYRLIATCTDQLSYLASMVAAQALFSSIFRKPEFILNCLAPSLLIAVRQSIKNFRNAFLADFDSQMLEEIESQAFFQNLEDEDQEFIRHFQISRLGEFQYRSRTLSIVAHYLNQSGLSVHFENEALPIDVHANELKQYRKRLYGWVKAAVNQIKNEHAHYLTDGKDALETFAAEATLPIAHVAQLLELQDDANDCPANFNHSDLFQYRTRKAKIENAKDMFLSLTETQKKRLVKRLIRGQNSPDELSELYKKITELAADLHQGKLTSILTIDTAGRISSQNMFAKAWQEAVGG